MWVRWILKRIEEVGRRGEGYGKRSRLDERDDELMSSLLLYVTYSSIFVL